MFCKWCGKKNKLGSTRCEYCNNALSILTDSGVPENFPNEISKPNVIYSETSKDVSIANNTINTPTIALNIDEIQLKYKKQQVVISVLILVIIILVGMLISFSLKSTISTDDVDYDITEKNDTTINSNDTNDEILENYSTAPDKNEVNEPAVYNLKFSVQDINGTEIKGAAIQILNENNEIVKEWKSDEEIESLTIAPGMYTLHEQEHDFYLAISDTGFRVDDDGNIDFDDDTITMDINNGITTITIINKPKENDFILKKWNIDFIVQDSNETEIKNVTIQILDKNGDEVAAWKSGDENNSLTIPMGTYTIRMEEPPEGYIKIPDYQLTDEEGKIKIDKVPDDNTLIISGDTDTGVTITIIMDMVT